MADKLVSIITPTWGRPDLLRETILHVRRQTYGYIEHIVVVDGPMDPEVEGVVTELATSPTDDHRLRVYSLGWRPTQELRRSFAVGALMLGSLVAEGEYQMWLCDDERMAVEHVELMVRTLEEPEPVDFAYPLVYLWKPGKPNEGYQVGSDPPLFGRVTSVMYRRSCLDRGMYRFDMPKYTEQEPIPHDWDIIKRWVQNGATWRMLNRETLSHRVDH